MTTTTPARRDEEPQAGRRPFGEGPNCLNALRLLFAALVIISHGYTLGAFGAEPHVHKTTLGTLGVDGFFAISGYLIMRSAQRSGSGRYAWHRALRILPGLWVCLLVTALVFAPLAPGRYSLGSGLHYILSNLGVVTVQPEISGTLMNHPGPSDWNGSLWTLPHEVACYVLLGVAAAARLLRRRWWLVAVFICLAGVLMLHLIPARLLYANWHQLMVADFLNFTMFFLAGSLLFLFRDRVPDSGWLVAGGMITVALALLVMNSPAPVAAVPLAYVVIWLATHAPLRSVGRRNDLSYGMYIYGFPIQQLLAAHRVGGVVTFSLLSLFGATTAAAASWFMVEQPALTLKALHCHGGSRVHGRLRRLARRRRTPRRA